MAAVTSRVSSFVEGLLYRGREGHLSFIGHRLGGLGVLLFLTIHIVDTSWAYFWPEGYGHALEVYRNPVFMVGEIVLVAAVLFHGVNGLKIIMNDTFPHWWNKHSERQSFWRVAVLTFVLWAPATFLMGRALLTTLTCGEGCLPETTLADVEARTNFALLATPLIFAVVLAVLAYGATFQSSGLAARPIARPRNLETYAWLFMRWSGTLLIPLVWGHVMIQDVLVGVHAITIDYVAMRWAMLGWQAYDIALLAFAFGHGMNGLRGVAEDYIHHPGWLSAARWLIFIGWLVITLIGAVAIIRGVAA
jgi:succinate dehydrogenase cytochrome b556 subunit